MAAIQVQDIDFSRFMILETAEEGSAILCSDCGPTKLFGFDLYSVNRIIRAIMQHLNDKEH